MSGNLEIIDRQQSFDLDEKRFYIPGLEFKSQCPKCSRVALKDMGDQYFRYPKTNVPIEVVMFCYDCEEEWVAGHVLLKIVVELVEQNKEEQ